MTDSNHPHVRQWRDYRADVSATRADALARLAPDARAAATLAAYRASRKRADWRRRAMIALAAMACIILAICAAI